MTSDVEAALAAIEGIFDFNGVNKTPVYMLRDEIERWQAAHEQRMKDLQQERARYLDACDEVRRLRGELKRAGDSARTVLQDALVRIDALRDELEGMESMRTLAERRVEELEAAFESAHAIANREAGHRLELEAALREIIAREQGATIYEYDPEMTDIARRALGGGE